MLSLFCELLLLTITTTSLAQRTGAGPAIDPGEEKCFTPPDREHHVSRTTSVCQTLFSKFLDSFGNQQNETMLWTPDKDKWGQPDTVHLPMVKLELNTNETEACLMEIVADRNTTGDMYTPLSVAETGAMIIEDCFSQDKCGEMPLKGPSGNTYLALCATIHKKPADLLSQPSCSLATGAGCVTPNVAPINRGQTAT